MKLIKNKVSIIVNCHNGENYLSKCINSILNQTYKNWEIIFWDNNSNDKSLKIIKSFKSPKIKIFKSKKKLKLYDARNFALKKVDGEYIAFLDVDDFWLNNKIEQQIKILKKNNVDICYTNFFIKNKNKLSSFRKKKLPSGKISKEILLDYPIYISTVLLKAKTLFKNNFSFNPKYEILGDFDLFYKLSKKFRFKAIQQPLSVYRSHSGNTSKKRVNLKILEMDDWIKKNKEFKNKYLFKNIEIENFYTKCNFYLQKKKIKLFFKNLGKVESYEMKIKLFMKLLIISLLRNKKN